MKVDFNRQFTDFHGKAMEGEANNIREAVCASLFSYNGKGDEKYKAYKLMRKIADGGGVADITAEEATLVKNACAERYNAGAYGQIVEIVEH